MTQRIEYTEEMVGNAHPTKADTMNRFINLITTAGDSLVGTAAATAARLAIGAANTKRFVNAAGTGQEWALGIYMGNLTRDMEAASGNVSYTGTGFKPVALVAFGGVTGSFMGIGGHVSATGGGITGYGAATYVVNTSFVITVYGADTGKIQQASLASFDANGFTLTWTKTGTPGAATASINYIAWR